MTELAIEKKPSKLPKVALILGVAFILFMAIGSLSLEIYSNYFVDYSNMETEPGLLGKLNLFNEIDTLYFVKIALCLAFFLCIGALFIFNAVEKRGRNSIIAATIFTVAILISIVLLFTIPYYVLDFLLNSTLLTPIIIIPLTISLGFWADETERSKIVKIGIYAIMVCLFMVIIPFVFRPFLYYVGATPLYIMLIILLGFLAERYRKNNTIFYICVALIPILFILTIIARFRFDFMFNFNLSAALFAFIAAIIYYFTGEDSQHKSVRVAYIAALATIVFAATGSYNMDMGVGIFPVIIFGIFILPAIECLNKSTNENSLMLKIAKILPLIAIVVFVLFHALGHNISLAYSKSEYDDYFYNEEPILICHMLGAAIQYILCIASAVMLFIEIKKCNETSQIESNSTENNK